MKTNLPVYVISLARAADRRESITALLDADGVEYELVDAVDGAQLDMNDCTPPVNLEKCWKRYGIVMPKGAVGCALSHINIWKRMIAEQTEYAVVLEDDARWQPDFWEVANKLPGIEWYWDAVLLCGVSVGRYKQVVCELSDSRELVRYHRLGRRATAYIIALSGANKLVRQLREIDTPFDIAWKDHWHTDMYFYEVAPPMADHSCEASTIDYKGTRPELNPMQKIRYQLWRNYRSYRRRRYHLTHPRKLREPSGER